MADSDPSRAANEASTPVDHRLHEQLTAINALDSTRLQQADEAYIAKLKNSGVTAINLTVAADDGPIAAMQAIVGWWRVLQAHSEDVFVGHELNDIARAKREGRVTVFFGFQDTAPMAGELALYEIFNALGIRFVQLTYQRRNVVGDGCGERHPAGLSKHGLAALSELNRLGIVVDLSHCSPPTTLDAIEHSTQPVIVSHSAARAICDTPRNKTDEEISALAEAGGVIGIPPKSGFLKTNGLETGSSMDDYVRHIEHVIDLVGIDHVGIGTDVGDERKYTRDRMAAFHKKYPEVEIIGPSLLTDRMHTEGLQSPATLYNITAALQKHGYSAEEVTKIMGGNFIRVFQQVWREA